MCTYSNKTKNSCQKFILMISLIMGLMGLVTLGFGLSQQGTVTAIKEMGFASFSAVSTGTLILGLLILLTGVLGCLTAKFKNPCFAIPFGLLTSIFGLILLIVGFLIIAATSPPVLKQAQKGVCGNGQISDLYSETVDKTLCSQFCPCDRDLFTQWQATIDDATLRKFGRTYAYKGNERNTYIKTGNQAPIVQLEFRNSTESPAPVSTFAECYTKYLKTNNTNPKMDKAKKFVEKGGFKSLKYMENQYECAAVCKTPLFYVTRSFTEQPTKSCLSEFVNQVAGNTFRSVAIVSIVTALIALCGCCGSFPLCSKYNDEEDDEDNK